jgi:hypothetical protein
MALLIDQSTPRVKAVSAEFMGNLKSVKKNQ